MSIVGFDDAVAKGEQNIVVVQIVAAQPDGMGLPQRLFLNYEANVQVPVVIPDPALDLIAAIANDKDHLIGGDVRQAVQNMTDDGVAGNFEQGFGATPGVRPHSRPVAGQ